MFLKCRLVVNGQELPVVGATYTEPENVLGGSLSVSLARPLVESIPAGASVTFEVSVGRSDGAGGVEWSPVNLLSNGKLAGRSYVIAWQDNKPGDTLQFSALNLFADRWGLAPMRPVIMYDPDKVDGESLTGDTKSYTRDEQGKALSPVIEPIAGLTSRQVLDRVYTNVPPALTRAATDLGDRLGRDLYAESTAVGTGCGFNRVITNLPTFPIERVDITLEGGYHGSASGLASLFEPVYFEDANNLFIIDPSRGIPAGFTPRTLPLSCVVEVTSEIAATETVNGIILVYRTRTPEETGGEGGTSGYLPSRRLVTENITTEDGLTEVQIDRDLTDWKNLATGQVDYTTEDLVTTRTYGQRGGSKVLLSEETIETDYTLNGKLKTGHTRRISAVYPKVSSGGSDRYEEVLVETCVIDWRADLSSPGDSVMLQSRTETEGVVLVEDSAIDGKKQRTPILDAVRGGLIKQDGTQSTERKPIRLVIERLEETGFNQAQVVTIIEDRLNNIVQTPPPVQSRPGSRSTSGGATNSRKVQAARIIRELIVDQASINTYGFRRAATLDIGELDPEEGRKIVKARLRRIANPRRRASITLPGIDFAIRRGSLVRPPLRSGYDTVFLVLGRTIVIKGLGTPNAGIQETLQAIELG